MSQEATRGASADSWSPVHHVLFGVLGGIGPAASAQLYQYVVSLRAPVVREDSDHVPLIIYNNPQIPNNNKAVTKEGPPSVPAMLYTINALVRAGATHIAIPCNTAHAFHNELQSSIGNLATVLNMVELTAKTAVLKGSKIGLLSTIGTIQSRIYHDAIDAASNQRAEVVSPSSSDQADVQNCITRIKGGEEKNLEVLEVLLRVANDLVDRGVSIIVTGCTEIPLVLNPDSVPACFPVELVDPMKVLALEIISLTERSKTGFFKKDICASYMNGRKIEVPDAVHLSPKPVYIRVVNHEDLRSSKKDVFHLTTNYGSSVQPPAALRGKTDTPRAWKSSGMSRGLAEPSLQDTRYGGEKKSLISGALGKSISSKCEKHITGEELNPQPVKLLSPGKSSMVQKGSSTWTKYTDKAFLANPSEDIVKMASTEEEQKINVRYRQQWFSKRFVRRSRKVQTVPSVVASHSSWASKPSQKSFRTKPFTSSSISSLESKRQME